MRRFAWTVLAAGMLASLAAGAGKGTVCTVTVNSADERETFRQYLPADKFDFVELVERGRPDWLSSACRQQVRCDVLIVSGHFAGSEFYSSKFDVDESLPVDEMERAACSASCPDLFSHLKEVYLFGCDSLKPDPVKSAAPEIVRGLVRAGSSKADAERFARALSERHAEASRDRMRRVFPNVPVIYGFSSLAPYGRVAGPMLDRHFRTGGDEAIGSGRPSSRLLALFAPSSMVLAEGQRATDPNADYRAEACRYYDDALTVADRLGFIQEVLRRDMPEVRVAFDRVERFLARLDTAERAKAPVSAALATLASDQPTRAHYLAITRDTQDPALRVRMIALARDVGWLTTDEQNAELAHTIHDVLASNAMGFGEVDLVCTLNKGRTLDASINRVQVSQAAGPAQAAALACLGSREGHERMLRALASPQESEVQIAQAYLRHHPITDEKELRDVVRNISRAKSPAAQARALETLARFHVSDREVQDELSRLFAQSSSLTVQRAIAEVFIRAGASAPNPELAAIVRKYRVKTSGEDLIDTLLRRLESGA